MGGGGLFLGKVKLFLLCELFHPFPLGSWKHTLQVVRPTPASDPNAGSLSPEVGALPETLLESKDLPAAGKAPRWLEGLSSPALHIS